MEVHLRVIYPGSFDPITFGHLDIIERAAGMFDKVLVTIAINIHKSSIFSADERIALIEETVSAKPWRNKVELHTFSGLLVEFARSQKVNSIIRGVRQYSDYEYEFRMALMNRRLYPDMETIFLMPHEAHSYTSSRLIKQVNAYGGDISHFVPPNAAKALHEVRQV